MHCGGVCVLTLDDNGICTACNMVIGATEGILYGISTDGTYAEVIGYTGTATKVRIAEEYNGLPVKVIYREAFKNLNITSVVIPDSITSIGDYAFYECRSLTSVTIPDSVTSIGEGAFSYCTSLTSVTIPDSVTSIDYYAFQHCTSLTSVTIPDSVTSIGSGAFGSCNSALYTEYELGKYVGDETNPYAVLIAVTNKNMSTYAIHPDTKVIGGSAFADCSRLTNITIPDGIRGISSYAFSNCTSLTSVTIPDSVTSIGDRAFYHCSSLTSIVVDKDNTVYQSIDGNLFSKDGKTFIAYAIGKTDTSFTIPNSVKMIGDYAFIGCSSLTAITIPDSVTIIGEGAFYRCSSLASITFQGTIAQWKKIEFGNGWNDDIPAKVVHCTDGDVKI